MADGNGNGEKTALAKTSSKAIDFKTYLDLRRKSLAEVLPKHLTPERVIKIALLAYSKTPKLRECSMESLGQAVMQAAELGLEPGGALGHAYLVPYGQTCTLIPGYRGLIELAKRSGCVSRIEARIVYRRDRFKLRFGLATELEHEPALEGDPGEVLGVYAFATMPDDEVLIEWMRKDQLDAIRNRSKASGSGPWVTDTLEMYRKTCVRRLCKYLPLSPERAETLAKALEADDEEAIDVTPSEPEPDVRRASRSDRMRERLAPKREEPEQPSEPHDATTGEVGEPSPAPDSAPAHVSAGGKVRIQDA